MNEHSVNVAVHASVLTTHCSKSSARFCPQSLSQTSFWCT